MNNMRLSKEIAVIIVIKLIVLTLIWQFFFNGNKVKVNSTTVEQHIFQAAPVSEPVKQAIH